MFQPISEGRSCHPELGEGGAFQVSLSQLQIDCYPYHLASAAGDRSSWIRYTPGSVHPVWLENRSGHKLNFFLFPFCKKIIDLPGGQINDPSSGKHYSLPFLPATPSSPSRTLEGLFELTRRPSRALDLSHALLLELQRYKDVRCCALGIGPWTL